MKPDSKLTTRLKRIIYYIAAIGVLSIPYSSPGQSADAPQSTPTNTPIFNPNSLISDSTSTLIDELLEIGEYYLAYSIALIQYCSLEDSSMKLKSGFRAFNIALNNWRYAEAENILKRIYEDFSDYTSVNNNLIYNLNLTGFDVYVENGIF